MLVYGLGHKVKRTGQLNLIEAACYPRDASPANTGLAPPPTADQYPSVVLSTDKVHIKLGECLSLSAHTGVWQATGLYWPAFGDPRAQ